MATNTIVMQLAKKSGMRNRVKGLLKSKMATLVQKPESKDLAQSSIERMSCVSEEKPGGKPCCLGVRILLESRNLQTLE